MKAISQPTVAARELRGYTGALLARSRSRALPVHALSLSLLPLSRLVSPRRPPTGRPRTARPKQLVFELSSLVRVGPSRDM